MLSFFKRKNNEEKMERTGEDTVIDSKVLLGDDTETSTVETVKTTLYIPEDMSIGTEDRYYFQFIHNELPDLKPNQISIAGIDLKREGTDIHVVAFIRHTVAQGLMLNEMPVTLVGPDDQRISSKVFHLTGLGVLPGNTSTPILFIFEAPSLGEEDIPKEGWKLAFEVKPKHRLDLAANWEQHLPQADKDKLQELLDRVPPPAEGEINIYGITGAMHENGNLHITVFIRNGNSFDINLEQLPLFVEDASNEVVAKGVFNLDPFTVKAYSSKPWTFVFPKEMITKPNVDLSRWRAFPPQTEQ